jgi:hypothetical protein
VVHTLAVVGYPRKKFSESHAIVYDLKFVDLGSATSGAIPNDLAPLLFLHR